MFKPITKTSIKVKIYTRTKKKQTHKKNKTKEKGNKLKEHIKK